MTFKGQSLADLEPEELEEAEAYVLTNIIKTQTHLQFLAAAYEEVSAEQSRRMCGLH